MNGKNGPKHVVIVGGGFAGLGYARKLASPKEVRVNLIDKKNYPIPAISLPSGQLTACELLSWVDWTRETRQGTLNHRGGQPCN